MCKVRQNTGCGLGFLGQCKLRDFIHSNNIFQMYSGISMIGWWILYRLWWKCSLHPF